MYIAINVYCNAVKKYCISQCSEKILQYITICFSCIMRPLLLIINNSTTFIYILWLTNSQVDRQRYFVHGQRPKSEIVNVPTAKWTDNAILSMDRDQSLRSWTYLQPSGQTRLFCPWTETKVWGREHPSHPVTCRSSHVQLLCQSPSVFLE